MGLFPRAWQLAPHCTTGSCGGENTNAAHARRVVQSSQHHPPSPHELFSLTGTLSGNRWVEAVLPVLFLFSM